MIQDADHLEGVRAALPVLERQVFLNTGTCGPLPQAAFDVQQACLHKEYLDGRSAIPGYIQAAQEAERLRARLASWVGASVDEIALTSCTTEGMNIVLWGMAWQPGDEIITTTQEHQGLLAPLAMLHQRFGVQVRYLPLNGDPTHDLACLEAAIGPRTRLFALSHVSYTTGVTFALQQMTALCRQAGVATLVDAAQSMGVMPTHLHQWGVDFFAAPAQKWLCGPEGMGFLFVDQRWISRLAPSFSGIYSIHEVTWFGQQSPHFVPAVGARRYKAGGYFRSLVPTWEASLQWMEESCGLDWIYSRIPRIVHWTRAQLMQVPGLEMVTPEGLESSLLCFRLPQSAHEAAVIRDLLQTKDIYVRDVPGQPPCLRLSIGFFTAEHEILHFLEVLSTLA